MLAPPLQAVLLATSSCLGSEGSGRSEKSDGCGEDMLQVGEIGLCFVTMLPLLSKTDVPVAFQLSWALMLTLVSLCEQNNEQQITV